MEKCKFCGAELEEGVTLCPSCGKENNEAEVETAAENTPAEETAEVTAQETAEAEAAAEETAEEAAAETAEEAAPAEAEEAAEEAEETTEEAAPAEAKEETKKATPGKIALAVVAVVVLVALIIALLVGGMGTANESADPTGSADAAATTAAQTEETVPATIPADTGLNDVTHKGSYSVSDEQAIASADTVVATIGDKTLTNGLLQTYYWTYVGSYFGSEYGYQALMYGMVDLSQPLDTQLYFDGSMTWQQYFLKCALQNWQSVQSMALEAASEGYTITEEAQAALDAIPANLEDMLETYDVENVETLLAQNMGAGVTIEDFVKYQQIYYEGVPYYEDIVSQFTATEEEVEAFFNENEEAYSMQGVTRDDKTVDVRHVLIMPEGATSETIRTETFSDEAWAAAEQEANELLAAWEQGDKSEESFAQMANEHTDDGNDANGDGEPDGGLYTGVTVGQMVEAFENWCFDEARKTGDYGIVKTEFGYHIMYYVNGELVWPYYAEQDVLAKKENEFLQSVVDKYPAEIDYSAIQLATIPVV